MSEGYKRLGGRAWLAEQNTLLRLEQKVSGKRTVCHINEPVSERIIFLLS